MAGNPDIPNELYYLDDNFSVRSLRKYQLKEILAAHHIPYLHSITRVDLIKLFQKHIKSRREEILEEYKKKELEKKNDPQEEYGRGRRVIHKPIKLENDYQEWPIRHRKTPEPSLQKDSDGFAIPSLPDRSSNIAHIPKFNAEDSFASSDDDTYKPKARVVKPKPVVKSAPKPTKKTRKFSPPSFNAEDSFASSGDEHEEEEEPISVLQAVEKEAIQHIQEHANSPILAESSKSVEPSPSPSNTTTEEEEEEDDTDYNADGDNTEDEDEELGEVDKEELVQLYKDQSVPPEIFYSSEYRVTTRSQKMAEARQKLIIWKARMKQIGYIFSILYLIFGTIGFTITTYARQKNGYCTNYPKAIQPIKNTSKLFSMLPTSCIPCPDHGICSGGELVCDTLYERKTPIYNIGHVLPIADDCVHNSVLGKYVGRVERKIKQQLAIHQGQIACKHEYMHPNEPVPISRISVVDVLADLKLTMKDRLPKDKLEEILVIALSAVLEDPKVYYWEIDDQRYLGTEHVQYPFICQVKRIYNNIPFIIKMYIVLFISAASAIYGASKDYRKSVLYKEKIDNLVKSTTDQLKQQYDNHTKEPTKFPSPALPVSQIRSLIVDVNDRRTIQDWQRVVEKIEHHPHIRKSFREVRGDPVEYWELTA